MIYGESNKLYCLTEVKVYEDYEFVGNSFQDGKFVAKGDVKYTFNPFEDTDVLAKAANLYDFNKLPEDHIEDFLDFFREFGLIGNIDNETFSKVRYMLSEPHFLTIKEQSYIDVEKLLISIKEAYMSAAKLLRVEDVNGDYEHSKLSAWVVGSTDTYLSHAPEHVNYRRVNNGNLDNTSLTKEYIASFIRRHSAFIESVQVIKNEFLPAISFPTLLDVAYFQLIKALFEGNSFNTCLNCKTIFLAKHGRQRFCAPLPNRKRSTCENTYNQRRKRERKKLEKENQ